MTRFAYAVTLILAFLVIYPVAASAQEVSATARWGVPTYGTAVEQYVLQHSVNGGEWITIATLMDTSFTFMVTEGDSHRIRVAAVDAEGRQGPFSIPSSEYVPGGELLGEPGQPGQPIVIE